MNVENFMSLEQSREDFLEENMFDLMAEDGIDFPPNDYNSRALQNVISLYDEVREKGIEFLSGPLARMEKKATASLLL